MTVGASPEGPKGPGSLAERAVALRGSGCGIPAISLILGIGRDEVIRCLRQRDVLAKIADQRPRAPRPAASWARAERARRSEQARRMEQARALSRRGADTSAIARALALPEQRVAEWLNAAVGTSPA